MSYIVKIKEGGFNNLAYYPANKIMDKTLYFSSSFSIFPSDAIKFRTKKQAKAYSDLLNVENINCEIVKI
jgi:hypothetical protein